MAPPPPGRYPLPVPRPPSPTVLRRVRRALRAWYAAEHRDFPWRDTSDPYAVLVSEVMLQQTQASRVAERFGRFLDRFPSPAALAAAPEREILAEWSGLGYNRRALALRRAAAEVATRGWPGDVAGLERLPGIGPYTARAVASLAFGVPVGVVDTNVRRWLVRRFALPVDAPPGMLQSLADALARTDGEAPPPAEAAAWTHATMEFGAAICRSRSPRCGECPVARGCPSRHRAIPVPVTRQAPFAGSRRALRGAVLRALVAAPRNAATREELAAVAGTDGPAQVPLAAALDPVLASLERDGLIHHLGGRVHLGPAPGEPVGTIGA